MALVSAWRAKKEAGHYVAEHTHKYYEVVFYINGEGVSCVNGVSCPYKENTCFLLPPHTPHDDRNNTEAEVICLEFSYGEKLPTVVCQQSSPAVYRVLRELLYEAREQAYGYREMCSAKITELCLLLLREQKSGSRVKNMEYVVNYLAENYHEKICLAECAAQLHVSYDYFQHAFKKRTGLSPQAFLISCRLEAARELLREGTMNCTEVAYRCGFSTSAQFSALFKRCYGVTPLRYRNQV